jgi:heat shock protein HtpX
VNRLKTFILLATLTALLLWVGQALGGTGGLWFALAVAAAMNLGAYWFADKIVLRMHHAVELGPAEAPELHAMVRELALRANLPMPKLYLLPEDAPNAFATGRNPRHGVVAVTAGLLRLLDRREVAVVIAHELGHIRHRDTLVMSVAATLVQMSISRAREFLADEAAARYTGAPLALAGALRKIEAWSERAPIEAASPATAHLFIHNPFTAQGLASLFRTHPPTKERVARLEAMAYGRLRVAA